MREFPTLSVATVTVATMTLELEHVRGIPALTGDMRPHAAVFAGDAFRPGMQGMEPLPVAAGFAEAMASAV